MELPLKNTQTLIGSRISTMIFNIYRNKPKYQVLISILFLLFTILCLPSTVYAITDPTSVPNNRFGIHIISPTADEASKAALLVNTQGDWGYITVVMEDSDMDLNKWQRFFNDLRSKHLIPIVRLATHPISDIWARPNNGVEEKWALFLDKLIWPVKNRYVIVYNEPNHGSEWEGAVNPGQYATILDKTISALKKKNPDFFIINAGLDASAPEKLPNYKDE